MVRDDDEIDRLLARGGLGGPARERILRRVIARVTPRKSLWRWLTIAIPATAAALLLLLWPRPAFTPKGGPAPPFLDVTCEGATGPECRMGATLLFHVGGAQAGGVLTAWADPVQGGERIWYFPSADGAGASVAAGATVQTLSRGVRLGPEQPPGRYVVHLVLARRSLTRSEAVSPPAGELLGEATVPIEVKP